MIYKQVVGLKKGQQIKAIQDLNGRRLNNAQVRTIMKLGPDVRFQLGDPIQRIIEISSDWPFGFTIVNKNEEFVCCLYMGTAESSS